MDIKRLNLLFYKLANLKKISCSFKANELLKSKVQLLTDISIYNLEKPLSAQAHEQAQGPDVTDGLYGKGVCTCIKESYHNHWWCF